MRRDDLDVLSEWCQGNGADVVGQIPQLLRGTEEADAAADYIEAKSLWQAFVDSVTWRMEQPGVDDIAEEVRAQLRAQYPEEDVDALSCILLTEVLRRSSQNDVLERVLTVELLTDIVAEHGDLAKQSAVVAVRELDRFVRSEFGQFPQRVGELLDLRDEDKNTEQLKRYLAPGYAEWDPRLSPAHALKAIFRLVPFTDRRDEMQRLVQWLGDEDEAVSFAVMTGLGGSGKSRLAAEFIERARAQGGWCAGFLLVQDGTPGALFEGRAPRLVVVDYAETRVNQVRALVDRLATHDAPKVRVLFIARERGRWWTALEQGAAQASASVGRALWFELKPVGDDRHRRLNLFQRAVTGFAGAGLGEVRGLGNVDLSAGHFSRALFVVAAALEFNLSGTFGEQPDELLDGILGHEAKYWNRLVETELDGPSQALAQFERDGALLLAATTVIGGAQSRSEASWCIERVLALGGSPSTTALAHVLREHLGSLDAATPGEPTAGSAWIRPLEPDLVGERLVERVFTDRFEALDGMYGDLGAESASRRTRILTSLNRIASRQTDSEPGPLRRSLAYRILQARVGEDVKLVIGAADDQGGALGRVVALTLEGNASVVLAREVRQVIPFDTVALRELALWSAEVISESTGADDVTRADRAKALSDLSIWCHRLRRTDRALAAAKEAVALRRELHAERPQEFAHNLAAALSNLGVCLGKFGQSDEGLAAEEESVRLLRGLNDGRSQEFAPDLARSLSHISTSLGDLGRPEEALAAAEEAVQLRRDAHRAQPETFAPNLARSLANLGGRLCDLGRYEEGLAAAVESVELLRELHGARPGAFAPDLATSLSNLGVYLGELDRNDEGLVVEEEAVRLWRGLHRARPDAFAPDLARSLSNLGSRHSDVGDHDAGIAAEEEAVRLRRDLHGTRPGTFAPDLAASLANLCTCLGKVDRNDEGLVIGVESVGLWRELHGAHPEAFAPNLAGALSSMGGCLANLERNEEALAAEDEAAGLWRELHSERPEAFAPYLAESLSRLVDRLVAKGCESDARVAATEGLELLSQMSLAELSVHAARFRYLFKSHRIVCDGPGRDTETD